MLKEYIEKHGIENCLFLVPMRPLKSIFFMTYTSSNDDPVLVPAKINEDIYQLENNYKITLESIYDEFGRRHYYISDLEHLIKDNIASLFVQKKFET